MSVFRLFILVAGLFSISNAWAARMPECAVQKPEDGDMEAGKTALEKMQNECLPRLKKIQECFARARTLSDAVTNFVRKFEKPSSAAQLLVQAPHIGGSNMRSLDINIWRNFLALEEPYIQSLEAVRDLAKKYQSIPINNANHRRLLDELAKDYSHTIRQIADLSESEYKLLAWIELVKKDLETSSDQAKGEISFLSSESCQLSGVSDSVSKLQGVLTKFGEDVADIHQHILEARKARQNLANYTYAATPQSP